MTSTMNPNGDTRSQVIYTYHDHPRFICATCSAVLVRDVEKAKPDHS
jgi:hypothetical protein